MRKSASKNYEQTTRWNTSDLAEGATLEGVYVLKDSFPSKFEEGKEVNIYVIEGSDGTNYSVFGSASIDRQFSKIKEGSYVWLTYVGKEPTKNGMTVKVFDIDYDDEYKN